MKFSLVIPAYNEAENIGAVVKNLAAALRTSGDIFEIVAVDNGSTDDTPAELQKLEQEIPELRITRVFPNQGYGNGILAGLQVAKGSILGWMHADNQVLPEDVVRVYRKLKDGDLDFCKAVRTNRDEHWVRVVQSGIYNEFFRLLFGGNLRDINGTPKLFRRELYEGLSLHSRDWFLDPEIVIKALHRGANIGEVEIRWNMRPGGSSHVSSGTWLQFVKNMIKYKLGIGKE